MLIFTLYQSFKLRHFAQKGHAHSLQSGLGTEKVDAKLLIILSFIIVIKSLCVGIFLLSLEGFKLQKLVKVLRVAPEI